MPTKLTKNLLIFGLIAAFALALACSDSNTVTGSDNPWSDIQLSKYSTIVRNIAPPVYDGGSALAKPAAIDSIWTGGDYPLLGKVFGENEPMSLYSNITSLDEEIDRINDVLAAQQDTITEEMEGETYHGVFEVEELTEAVAIPEQAQAVGARLSRELLDRGNSRHDS